MIVLSADGLFVDDDDSVCTSGRRVVVPEEDGCARLVGFLVVEVAVGGEIFSF
jgi:hypothetical protein